MVIRERNRIKKVAILQGFFSQQFLEEFSDNSIFLSVFEISHELARFSGIENPILPGFSKPGHTRRRNSALTFVFNLRKRLAGAKNNNFIPLIFA